MISIANNQNINNNILWKNSPIKADGNPDTNKTTMFGQIYKAIDCNYHEARNKALLSCYGTADNGVTKKYTPIYSCKASSGDISAGVIAVNDKTHKFVWRYITDEAYANVKNALDAAKDDAARESILKNAKSEELASITTAGQVFGAVWNDFAEFRHSEEKEAGRVICENGDGSLSRSTKRL
jgi:phage tail sheath gpL-like